MKPTKPSSPSTSSRRPIKVTRDSNGRVTSMSYDLSALAAPDEQFAASSVAVLDCGSYVAVVWGSAVPLAEPPRVSSLLEIRFARDEFALAQTNSRDFLERLRVAIAKSPGQELAPAAMRSMTITPETRHYASFASLEVLTHSNGKAAADFYSVASTDLGFPDREPEARPEVRVHCTAALMEAYLTAAHAIDVGKPLPPGTEVE